MPKKTFTQPSYNDFTLKIGEGFFGEDPDTVVINDGDGEIYIEKASIPRLVASLTKAYGKLS